MKLAHISIKNILGIQELEIEPGKINIISGHNEAGKTSVMEAIKVATQGGNDATLISKGAEKGEIVLVFDNFSQITRTLERGKTGKIKYTDANGINIPSPQSALNQLFDKISINPIEFMKQSGKDRLETLLTAINIDIPVEDIKAKLNGSAAKVKFHPELNGLALIDNISAQIFEERTVTNRLLKQSQSHAVELSQTLESMDKTEVTELKNQYEELQTKKTEIREESHQKEMYVVRNSLFEISVYETEMDQKIAELKEGLSKFKDTANQKKDEAVKAIHEAETKQTEGIISTISELKVKIDNAQIVENTKENLTKAQKSLREYQKQSESMTNELDSLKVLKTSITNELPITGLTIHEGEIFVDDIPYERLNTAKQLEIALEVAKLRAGKLNLICVDGIEVFDSKTLATFKELAQKTDHQYFLTRVTDEQKLTVVAEA